MEIEGARAFERPNSYLTPEGKVPMPSKFTPANPILLNCEVCGCEIQEFPSHAANRRACSRKCYAVLRVALARPLKERFWKRVNKNGSIPAHCPELGPCWEWVGKLIKKGYGRIMDDDKSVMLAHRASWKLHFYSPPPDKAVCHKCDNPKCVRPDHLFIGTKAENNADMRQKGRHAHGPKPHTVINRATEYERRLRLRAERAELDAEILRLKESGITTRQLSVMYGFSVPSIYQRIYSAQGRKRYVSRKITNIKEDQLREAYTILNQQP